MCVKGSARKTKHAGSQTGPLTHMVTSGRSYGRPRRPSPPGDLPSGEDTVFVFHAPKTMRAGRTPTMPGRPLFDACAQNACAQRSCREKNGPRRTADHQEDRVRALPYDLPKATTRVKGPVGLFAWLVWVGGPLDTRGWEDPGHTGGHEAPPECAARLGTRTAPHPWALPWAPSGASGLRAGEWAPSGRVGSERASGLRVGEWAARGLRKQSATGLRVSRLPVAPCVAFLLLLLTETGG
jgi:hypothetical protein